MIQRRLTHSPERLATIDTNRVCLELFLSDLSERGGLDRSAIHLGTPAQKKNPDIEELQRGESPRGGPCGHPTFPDTGIPIYSFGFA